MTLDEQLSEIATRCALRAGELLLDFFDRPSVGVSSKSTPTDLVSDADRESEALLMKMIAEERPDDGIVAEEGGREQSTSGLRWIVDPLDGTVNFLFGIPQWCVSIAVADDEGTRVGVVHDPNREETFVAARERGTVLNGSSVSVSDRSDITQALVGTGFAYDVEVRREQAAVVARVLPRVRDVRRMGSAALDFCATACGRLDGFYERGLAEWDRAAGELIVTEAGGIVGDLPGTSKGPFATGVVCAGPNLYEALRDLVS